ncbi:MAG TPA: leucine-rich repeat domain-containing protein [Hymenobacter sp.]
MSKKVLAIFVLLLAASGIGYAVSLPADRDNEYQTQEVSKSAAQDQPKPQGNESVDMSGKQLTTLPDSVLAQTGIRELDLSNNQLTSLPDDISRLSSLEALNVENNRLTTLPASIGQLRNLKSADFSNNRLTSLPDELGNLAGLDSLNLSGYQGSSESVELLKAKLPNTQIKI